MSEPRRLFCPVHAVWHEPGLTICPIDDCRTKLEERWNYNSVPVPNPNDPPVPIAETAVERSPRKPVWAALRDRETGLVIGKCEVDTTGWTQTVASQGTGE